MEAKVRCFNSSCICKVLLSGFESLTTYKNIIMELPFTKEEIITAVGIHPLKVKDIFIYGSRVYGSAKEHSDYDFAFVSGNLLPHEEKRLNINGIKLNVHVYTPDVFKEALAKHDIMNLECVFAPEWAIMQEKSAYSREINKKKLVKNNLTQSKASWGNAKLKIYDGDIIKGQKGLFHSLRMLMFAAQIIEHGKIVDFSVGNTLYEEIMDCDEFDWRYYSDKYLPLKVQLEDKLKSLVGEE